METFIYVWDLYNKEIFYYIYSIVKNYDIANDILQETAIAVYLNLDKLRDDNSVRYWIYRIASNKIKSHYKSKKKEMQIDHIKEGYQQDTTDFEVKQFSEGLKSPWKEAFLLYVLGDFSYTEISKMLNLPYWQVRRAIIRLSRKYLEGTI